MCHATSSSKFYVSTNWRHAKNHRYKLGYTFKSVTPARAPLHGESGYAIERLLQAHRKGFQKPSKVGNINVLFVKDEFRKKRYIDLKLHYGFTHGGELHLNATYEDQSLDTFQLLRHVDYFRNSASLAWKTTKRCKKSDGGGEADSGDKGGHNGGHSEGDKDSCGDSDGANDGRGNKSRATKKSRSSSNHSDLGNSSAALAVLNIGDSLGEGKGLATKEQKFGEKDSSSDECSSSSMEDAEDVEDQKDREKEKLGNLLEEIVQVGSETFTKYTADCSRLTIVSEDSGSKAFNVEELRTESKGIVDRKALLVGGGEMSKKVLDGIMASLEKCTATVTFCDDHFKERKSSTFRKDESVCVKLKLANPEESGSVAVAHVSLYTFSGRWHLPSLWIGNVGSDRPRQVLHVSAQARAKITRGMQEEDDYVGYP